LLTALESNVFAALAHHGACASRSTYDGTNGRTLAAADNSADDCPDSGGRPDLGDIVLGGAATFHATFRINFSTVISAHWSNLNELSVETNGTIIRETNLVKCKLEL
jgi:hypothetical protein